MQSNVGGGLLPIAVCQLIHLQLPHCYRGQAPSHSLISMYQVLTFGIFQK